jgi:hypothetical protein
MRCNFLTHYTELLVTLEIDAFLLLDFSSGVQNTRILVMLVVVYEFLLRCSVCLHFVRVL